MPKRRQLLVTIYRHYATRSVFSTTVGRVHWVLMRVNVDSMSIRIVQAEVVGVSVDIVGHRAASPIAMWLAGSLT
eukprot:8656691-Lingulodinium_polyedra.AAC.1